MTSDCRPAPATGPAGAFSPAGRLTCLRPRRGAAPGLWHLLTEAPPARAARSLAGGPAAPGDRVLVVQVDGLACPAAVPLARWVDPPAE